MSYTISIIGLNAQKVEIDWFNIKKVIFGTIRGDKFLCIFLLSLITSSTLNFYNIFLSKNPPSLKVSFLFYTISLPSSPHSTCKLGY